MDDGCRSGSQGSRLEQLVDARPTSCSTPPTTSPRATPSIALASSFASRWYPGAGVRFDGQIAVFDLRRDDSPCYHCLFPEEGDLEEMRCAVMGVFAPLVGIIGSMQAAEALKVIMGIGEPLHGRLLLLDALSMQFRTVRTQQRSGMPGVWKCKIFSDQVASAR